MQIISYNVIILKEYSDKLTISKDIDAESPIILYTVQDHRTVTDPHRSVQHNQSSQHSPEERRERETAGSEDVNQGMKFIYFFLGGGGAICTYDAQARVDQ